MTQEVGGGWGGLSAIGTTIQSTHGDSPLLDGDPNEIVMDEQLPLIRFKLPPEEEDLESIQTIQAWAVDIPDPRLITRMLQWLKRTGMETPELGHLKRIRKKNDVATLLLTTSPTAPTLPEGIDLPNPYNVSIPVSPALTPISLSLKSSFWPTVFAPPRKGEAEDWSRGKVQWARDAMRFVVKAAVEAQTRGELPIAAHIPTPYDKEDESLAPTTSTACDTRNSSTHPLRHAVINVIRRMADHRAPTDIPRLSIEGPTISSVSPDSEDRQNGTNYLLTSLTLFTTHEPCIMCSMALIHSRVKEVIYLYPMTKTGGCGGVACLPTLKGVNHRFAICRWRSGDEFGAKSLRLDFKVDA